MLACDQAVLQCARERGGFEASKSCMNYVLCSESGYQWSQTLYDTTGNLLTNPDFSSPVKKTLQVHVCRNITKAMNANCSAKGVAPVYMVSL